MEWLFEQLNRARITEQGADLVLAYAPASIGLWAAAGLVAVGLGVAGWIASFRVGLEFTRIYARIASAGVVGLGLLVLAVIVPATSNAEIRLVDRQLHRATGLWSQTGFEVIDLSTIRAIEVVEPEGSAVGSVWALIDDEGSMSTYNPPDLLAAHSRTITDRLAERGIAVTYR